MKKPIVLWGGTDVDSFLYGEKRSKYSQQPDHSRDDVEWVQLEQAVIHKTPVVGVCRGAQLICAFNGGKLYQHSEPKEHSHSVEVVVHHVLDNEDPITHEPNELYETTEIIEHVSAGHHQIMRPAGNFILLGWNPEPVKVWRTDDDMVLEKNTAEVVWYPDTKMLAIQPHPEWAGKNDPFVKWINNTMKELEIDYEF